jgi:hypothetical protein
MCAGRRRRRHGRWTRVQPAAAGRCAAAGAGGPAQRAPPRRRASQRLAPASAGSGGLAPHAQQRGSRLQLTSPTHQIVRPRARVSPAACSVPAVSSSRHARLAQAQADYTSPATGRTPPALASNRRSARFSPHSASAARPPPASGVPRRGGRAPRFPRARAWPLPSHLLLSPEVAVQPK